MKLVYLAKGVEEMSNEEVLHSEKNDHAGIVEELPGLQKYTLGEPSQSEGTDWGGVAELHFESSQAMQKGASNSRPASACSKTDRNSPWKGHT